MGKKKKKLCYSVVPYPYSFRPPNTKTPKAGFSKKEINTLRWISVDDRPLQPLNFILLIYAIIIPDKSLSFCLSLSLSPTLSLRPSGQMLSLSLPSGRVVQSSVCVYYCSTYCVLSLCAAALETSDIVPC